MCNILVVLRLQLEDGVDELFGALAVQLLGGKGLVHHGGGGDGQKWYGRRVGSHGGGLWQ